LISASGRCFGELTQRTHPFQGSSDTQSKRLGLVNQLESPISITTLGSYYGQPTQHLRTRAGIGDLHGKCSGLSD
jgi:hypothetical protein